MLASILISTLERIIKKNNDLTGLTIYFEKNYTIHFKNNAAILYQEQEELGIINNYFQQLKKCGGVFYKEQFIKYQYFRLND